MLLASLYLVLWEYDRLKPLLPFWAEPQRVAVYRARLSRTERAGYLIAALGGIGAVCVVRGLAPASPRLVLLGGAAVFVSGIAVALGAWLFGDARPKRAGTGQWPVIGGQSE